MNKFILEKIENTEYAKIGDGARTMIMLPGLSFKSVIYSAELVASAYCDIFHDYTIYLFDDRYNSNCSIKEHADDIASHMKSLNIKNAYVFGVSMGGMTGQYLAINHPTLVKKLFLSSTTSLIDDNSKCVIEKWQSLAKSGDIKKLIHESIRDIYSQNTIDSFGKAIEDAIGDLSDKEISDFIALTNAILKFNCHDKLEKIKCPCMIVGAKGDRVISHDSIQKTAEGLGCDMYMYGTEYGHAVYDEADDHKWKIIDFFEK